MLKRSFSQQLTLLTLPLLVATFTAAQSLPEQCLSAPSRTEVCPNLLYKRSPLDVHQTNTQAGDIICICMADFAELRMPPESRVAEVEFNAALARHARTLQLSEQDLLTLIRR